MALNEDFEPQEEYIYQGRIALDGPADVQGMTRHKLGAVIIAHPDQPIITDTEGWEGIQCEIIIRPLKRLGHAKHASMRLDHAAMALGDNNQWIKPPKKKK